MISQSARATWVRHHSLTLFGILLNRRGFSLSVFKGHPHTARLTLRIGGNRRLNVRFPSVAVAIWGKIADNAINGCLLDTLVPKLKKLMMNKHSESIAKAIQVPYRPQQFSRGITPSKADKRGPSDTQSVLC